MGISAAKLRLIQRNGRPLDLLWQLPAEGGGMDGFVPMGHGAAMTTLLPGDFPLHAVQWVRIPEEKPGDRPLWWFLNMQNMLVCAINGLRLRPNNRHVIADGDTLQLGALVFAVEFEAPAQANAVQARLDEGQASASEFAHQAPQQPTPASAVATAQIREALLERPAASAIPTLEQLASQPDPSAPSALATPARFDWDDLQAMLGDPHTERSLQDMVVEKSDLLAQDAMQAERQRKQAALAQERNTLADAEIEQMLREDDLMDQLHKEYLSVLQDPKLLTAQTGHIQERVTESEANTEALQDLMHEADRYDSLHDLLGKPQSIDTLVHDLGDLENYNILEPEAKTDVMRMFAPAHLANKPGAGVLEEDQDILKGLLVMRVAPVWVWRWLQGAPVALP